MMNGEIMDDLNLSKSCETEAKLELALRKIDILESKLENIENILFPKPERQDNSFYEIDKSVDENLIAVMYDLSLDEDMALDEVVRRQVSLRTLSKISLALQKTRQILEK